MKTNSDELLISDLWKEHKNAPFPKGFRGKDVSGIDFVFVIDGFWVDLHISKVLYTPRDHDAFDQVVKSVKFEPKKAGSPQ